MDNARIVVSQKHIRIEQTESDPRAGRALRDARLVLSDASRIIRESEHIEHHIKHTESSGFTLEINRVTMDTSSHMEGSPLRSTEASFGSTEGADGINWKERCHTLEASLHKFKNRAAQIRELLATKMDELNEKTEAAEKRAELAEEKCHQLQEQLNSSSWPRGDADRRIQSLENELRIKDKMLGNLQQQLTEMKSVRAAELRLVEEKSCRIKEWVAKKLRELEAANENYKMENETMRDQVETLRARLQSLPSSAAREIHRISVQEIDSRCESSVSYTPPEIPQRPSSSILEVFRQERELETLHTEVSKRLQGDSPSRMQTESSPELDDNMVEHDEFEPLYQEIDENHESKYEPKCSGPPQVRIERKVFPNPQLMSSSLISSTTGSEEMLDSQTSHTSSTGATSSPPQLRPLRDPSATSSTPSPYARPKPKVKADAINVPAFLPLPRTQSPPAICPFAAASKNHSFSALATVPRRKKDSRLQATDLKPASHDHRLPGTKDDTRTIPYEHLRADANARVRIPGMKPPTPPMRRLPSWENRIYAIANVGLRIPDPGTDNRESSFPVTDGLYTEHIFSDLAVPVYTTLKGKAAQIRSTPFTGESSSDSSDNDESSISMSACENEAVVTVAGPSPKNSSVRTQQVNQTSSGATKRAVSSHSIGSETSSDYAVPPDEVSILTDSSDNSEPEQKLLKCTTEHFKKDSLERSGYLTKLGGKVKNWKRRWFVLRNGEMLYYKSPSDVVRKPQGYLSLDGQTRITKTEGAHTFELATSKRTYYMTADSKEDMDQWIRVLQNVLRKQAADHVLSQSRIKEIMKGWLIKTKHGRSRRCWCVLMGKFFMYYKAPSDKTPLGQISLRDARIEEVDRSCDSETDSDDTAIPDYTLGIWPLHGGPTYLMIPTKQEKDSWLYHLTVAAGGGTGNVGSEFEQIISKLMEAEGDPGCIYWKHPLVLHTKEPLTKPLTTLPSEELLDRAISLFKSCHMFMNMAIDSPQIDYHVSLAQSILDTCLQQPELQNELYCQLIKQTSRHPPLHKSGIQNLLLCGSHSWFLCDASPTSPTNSLLDGSDSKLNPGGTVFLQGWQLLSMCVSLFLPRQSILWYLKAHLQRHADPRHDIGKYAIFCQRALERTMHNGGREARPSKMEVLSILLRNPYHHSQPISIPVHFLNGLYQVVSFDGSTTVQEFIQSLNKAICMRDCALSGFSLFTDDPAGQELEHCLKGHLKLCDVISKWEQAFFHHYSHRGPGRIDQNRTVKLAYKNRLYFKSLIRTETEQERLLLAFQVNDDIMNGRFPLNKDLGVELAALMAQIEFGDFRTPNEVAHISGIGGSQITAPDPQQQLSGVVEKFYPNRYRTQDPMDLRVLERRIQEKWMALKGRAPHDCVRIYLTVARKWPFFGAKLFSAKFKYGEVTQVWLAVQEESISVLEYATLKPVSTYEYGNVVTFGGCRDDFMLVVSLRALGAASHPHRSDRLLFAMNKAKVLEVTILMASYINSRGQHKNILHKRSDTRLRLLANSHTSQTSRLQTAATMDI